MIIYDEGVAMVTPASWADCHSGWSCLWGGWQAFGRMLQFQDVGNWQNMAWYSFNNNASSVYNHKINRSTLYAANPGGGGAHICRRAGYSFATLNAFWDNNISSIKIRNGNNC